VIEASLQTMIKYLCHRHGWESGTDWKKIACICAGIRRSQLHRSIHAQYI